MNIDRSLYSRGIHLPSSYLQVLHWKSRVDRSAIDRLRGFQNPPMLVGQVMEMVMILIGKRLPAQRQERGEYPARDEQSGRFSNSSSSTKFTTGTKKGKRLPCPSSAIWCWLSIGSVLASIGPVLIRHQIPVAIWSFLFSHYLDVPHKYNCPLHKLLPET